MSTVTQPVRFATLGAALALLGVALLAWGPAIVALATSPEMGGVDLQNRMAEVRVLWGGVSPYGGGPAGGNAVYPPASYVLLGPLGVGPYDAWAWAWALSIGALLVALGAHGAKVVSAARPEVFLLATVLPFSIAGVAYGTQNGQLHVHCVAALVGGMTLLLRERTTPASDAMGVLFVLLALIKPTVAGPALLLLVRRDRAGVLGAVLLGYLACTGLGLLLAGEGLRPLSQWLFRAQGGAEWGAGGSYGNVHAWGAMAGLRESESVLTLMVLVAWGALGLGPVTRGRGVDALPALALACFVARIAVYHQDYDDTLLIPMQLALLAEVVRAGPKGLAGGTLAALVLVQLPGREHLGLGGATPSLLEVARVIVWGLGAWICLARLREYPALSPGGV